MAERKRSEGFAFFLPVVGVLLILPPIVMLFDKGLNILGIPLIVAYLFATWLLLVFASFNLTRFLPKAQNDSVEKPARRDDAR